VERPDLHHIQGRDAAPHLYFADENLVWLVRLPCHDYAHNSANIPGAETQDDTERSVVQTPSGGKILAVQEGSGSFGEGKSGRTIYRSVPRSDASILERKKKASY
jgi:hypothetical protein